MDDPDPGVRATALGSLERAGLLSPAVIARALADPDAVVRRRAASLAGGAVVAGPDGVGALVACLVETLADTDPLVAEAAAWALGETGGGPGSEAAVDGLCAVARDHDDPLVRESAVAALGAIGAPEALDVVLGALDGPPALRRRAAVALAGFDDPRVDAGLKRCLTDRDWQVRAVAEELLRAH